MHASDNSTPQLPDRLCEDWRFGSPHLHATAMAQLLRLRRGGGHVTIDGVEDSARRFVPDSMPALQRLRSIGSDALLALHRARPMMGAVLFLEHDYDEPITILYQTEGVFTPVTRIVAAPGVHAHIIERHVCRGRGAAMLTARIITARAGASLAVELHEEGCASSRAMNISNISVQEGAAVRHLTTHGNHAWAREETIAELTGRGADARLFSANSLADRQTLDQHTRQIHSCGGASSNLLYKNVLNERASAVFAGNIFVAPGAHDTDAYQSNRNMLLSENATVHSLPGLEILADRVRCSHGSASAPMDEQQLFYLLSRGIPRLQAQLLVARGFLDDAADRFRSQT